MSAAKSRFFYSESLTLQVQEQEHEQEQLQLQLHVQVPAARTEEFSLELLLKSIVFRLD